MPEYRTPTAVAFTDDGVYYNDGRQHQLSPRTNLSDLSHVLGGAAKAFAQGEGVIVIDRALSDVQPSIEQHLPQQGGAWMYTTVRAWTTFVHAPTGTVVHLGLLRELESGRIGPLLTGHTGPADIAYRLGRYAEVTGTLWRYTAGVTGCQMLRQLHNKPGRGTQPLWSHKGPIGMRGTGPMIWRGGEQPTAEHEALVHGFDVNAMYLAALKNAYLAWSRLEPYTGPFDPTYAGWWEVDVQDLPVELYDGVSRPPVFPKQHVHKGSVWLTTPVVKYLMDLGHNPQILMATVSGNAPTLGRPVAEKLAQARTAVADDRRVLGAIKRTYAELVGMMAREGGSMYRPDWAATIQDLARVNMLRRLDKAAAEGFVPFMVKTDAAYFMSTEADARTRLTTLLGVGDGPGMFKHIGTVTARTFAESKAARG